MNTTKHTAFISYLNFLRNNLGFSICIKDRAGFFPYVDKELSMALIHFFLHANTYCEYIKSDKGMFEKCSLMGDQIEKKCLKVRKTFFGVCHAGVGEYIVPMFTADGVFLGYISVGCFQFKGEILKKRISNLSKKSKLLITKVHSNFNNLMEKVPYDCDTITEAFGMVVAYLVNAYRDCEKYLPLKSQSTNYTNEDLLLSRIIDSIRRNYTGALSVSILSSQCGCSESYINHIFKRKTGVTVKTYINWLRIEDAKISLRTTNNSITEIALKTGFNDSNYFSKVFLTLTGVTPTDFRKK